MEFGADSISEGRENAWVFTDVLGKKDTRMD